MFLMKTFWFFLIGVLRMSIGKCTKGSEPDRKEYPSVLSLQDVSDPNNPTMVNANYECGGVLLTTNTVLTNTYCIENEVEYGNPLNRTVARDFRAIISPCCMHGEGAEVVQVRGYHIMEDEKTKITVLELKENVTSLKNLKLPVLRKEPLTVGSNVTMVSYVAAFAGAAPANQDYCYDNQIYSRTMKKINYQIISDEECNKILNGIRKSQPFFPVAVDGLTETCAVPYVIGEVSVCDAHHGNPLYDSDRKIAGVITWFYQVNCNKINSAIPIIFADVSKLKIQKFIAQTETQSLHTPPNITDGCGDNQTFQAAPWSVSIQALRVQHQAPWYDEHHVIKGPTPYFHFCSGTLIDNGTKVMTVAQCLWNNAFSSLSKIPLAYPFDLREHKELQGRIQYPIFASLAPKCRHFNGIYKRIQLTEYWIHPQYDGNPQHGNDIAIISLKEQFPPDQSFPGFKEFLKSIGDRSLPLSLDVQDIVFYSWGAEMGAEAGAKNKQFFYNNYFPAKEVSMKLIDFRVCIQTEFEEGRAYDYKSELCAEQSSDQDIIKICSYDEGGPLIGRMIKTNKLVLLGLKSQPADQQCRDQHGLYEVFTDLKKIKIRDFILSILDPLSPPLPSPEIETQAPSVDPLSSSFATPEAETQAPNTPNSSFTPAISPYDSPNVTVIIVLVVGGSLLLILSVVFLIWRSHLYNKINESTSYAIQLQPLIEGPKEVVQDRSQTSMALHIGNERKSFNKGLIFPDTPARGDFDMTIDFHKDLQVGERLGTGAFGSVYKAIWLTRNMEVAVKIIHAHILERLKDNQEKGENFFNSIMGELSLLSRINSLRIVKCYGGSLKPPNVCLVLEYVSGGSLDRFIHSYYSEIPTGLIMRVAQGIAEGLDALHPTVVHRDLKPQNVLLDNNYQVKLADFGMSKMKEDTHLSETKGIKGTPAYIAPEALKEESIDEKCDIYALGLIMWEMVTKERPWHNLNFPTIMNLVANKNERPSIPNRCPEELKRLIQRCWATNPRERPTAREVVQRLTILQRGPTRGLMAVLNEFQGHFNNFYGEATKQSKQNWESQTPNLIDSQFSIQS